MRRFNQQILDRIQAGVAKAEGVSTLEIVVRVVEASGSYRDVRYLSGALLATVALGVVLFSPLVIRPVWVIPLVGLCGLIGAQIGAMRPIIRLLTRPERRNNQSLKGAHASFFEEGVSATQDRTGVLLYCSLLEDRVELLVDHPLEGKAPGAAWGSIARIGRASGTDICERLHHMLDGLASLGAERLPSTEDNPNELPDEVRLG